MSIGITLALRITHAQARAIEKVARWQSSIAESSHEEQEGWQKLAHACLGGPGGPKRGIGPTQRMVLASLIKHKRWYRGCGWVWTTDLATERFMRQLVARGFAVVTAGAQGRSEFYPAAAGVAEIAKGKR